MSVQVVSTSISGPLEVADLLVVLETGMISSTGPSPGVTTALLGGTFPPMSVINHGTIAGRFAISTSSFSNIQNEATGRIFGNVGIEAALARENIVVNDGLIYGSATGLLGQFVQVHNTGVIKTGFSSYNHPLVSGEPANAAVIITSGPSTSFENSGTVQTLLANSWAYFSLAAATVDTVINKGRMIGQIALGGSDDRFDTSAGTVKGTINGDDGNDTILGSAFSDTIFGGAGLDTLTGNAGNDTLNGGAGGDNLNGGLGTDTVSYANSVLGVNVNLLTGVASGGDASGDRLISIENIVGSAASNRLTGNNVANSLNGGAGNDTINGGAGSDLLTGGLGADQFLFTTAPAAASVDTIKDFDPARDVIVLENTGTGLFNKLSTGILNSSFLKQNATGVATDADDRIVYNTATGALSYDSNGSAAGGAVKFAVLTGKPAGLVAADFLVI